MKIYLSAIVLSMIPLPQKDNYFIYLFDKYLKKYKTRMTTSISNEARRNQTCILIRSQENSRFPQGWEKGLEVSEPTTGYKNKKKTQLCFLHMIQLNQFLSLDYFYWLDMVISENTFK